MSEQKICLNCKYSRISVSVDCDESSELTCWAPQNTEVSLITGDRIQKGEPLCSTQRNPELSVIRCSKDGSWFEPMENLELSDVTDAIKESLNDASIIFKKMTQDVFDLWS
jgi:hypothetical protein